MGQKTSKSEFNISKARTLVKLCLSEDLLYNKYLKDILKLNDYHFEELFKGNTDLNYNIGNSYEFLHLVYKFEDYNKIIYNWHKDKSKYNQIVLLWKKNISISNLYDLTKNELENELNNLGLSIEFKYELIRFLSTTIESKSAGIFEYMKEQLKLIYSLITFSKNEQKTLEINNNNLYSKNLFNIIEGLIVGSLPFIQKYLEQIPDLDPLSKSEVTKESSSLLKKVILKIFKKNESNSYIHKELLDITKDFKYGKEINLLLNKVKGFYSSPIIQICHLALSFLNLVNSIKTFKENKQDFKILGQQFSREFSNICSDFEEHKREIGLLNLSKIRESTQRIREVHEKILSDKNRLSNLIERIRKKISEKESEKKKGGIAIALGCLGALSSIIGAVFTGGASLIIYAGAAALNGAAIGIHSANIIEINKNIEVYNNMLIKGIDKEKEINILLDKIRIEYNI